MKILVCIAQVSDTTSKIAFTDNNTAFATEGLTMIINPYDEWYALVRAIELKEKAVNTATTQKQTLDEHVDSLVSSASYKADDIISALESKLKDLKEKNKKLHKNHVSS